jgi:ABC-2 type transport system ATP-binding protein
MSSVLESRGLGKRYGRLWALSDCDLAIPAGRIVGLVGPNGAGKSTLLHLAVGLLAPTAGVIEVLGARPAKGPDQLAQVGFVAQDAPAYASLSVADHLRMGALLNPNWDRHVAERRLREVGLAPRQKAGRLSGGQRAQLALTLAIAKRPRLLLLDEPVAGLDPLARHEFLGMLMESVAEQEMSVVLSSHLIADLERVCDYLVVLIDSRVELAGDVEELLGQHRRLIGARCEAPPLASSQEIIEASHTDRQSSFLVRSASQLFEPDWAVEEIGLEDLVLAYMARDARHGRLLRLGSKERP